MKPNMFTTIHVVSTFTRRCESGTVPSMNSNIIQLKWSVDECMGRCPT